MDRAVIFLGLCAIVLLAGKNKQTVIDAGTTQSINPNLYNRFIQRKAQGTGSRGFWQFVYTNEIYWLLAQTFSNISPAVKDPLLYEVYTQCEAVIQKGENSITFSSSLSSWLQNRFPSLLSEIKADILAYEQKLFTVSNRLWNGKPLQ